MKLARAIITYNNTGYTLDELKELPEFSSIENLNSKIFSIDFCKENNIYVQLFPESYYDEIPVEDTNMQDQLFKYNNLRKELISGVSKRVELYLKEKVLVELGALNETTDTEETIIPVIKYMRYILKGGRSQETDWYSKKPLLFHEWLALENN